MKNMLGELLYNEVWEKSHDAIERTVTLGELYNNVPEELKNKRVRVLELHSFEPEDKEAIVTWLNRE